MRRPSGVVRTSRRLPVTFLSNGNPRPQLHVGPAGDGPVAVGVANERHSVVVEIGDDDVPFLARRRGLPIVIENLHQQILGRQVQALRADRIPRR